MIQTEKIRLGDRKAIVNRFAIAISRLDSEGSLAEAAGCLALLEYPGFNQQIYFNWLDDQGDQLRHRLPPGAGVTDKLSALNQRMFDELGFRGNRKAYFDPRNSFLNEVIERRLGIPISLSLIYLELGRRIGLSLRGVGLPGHFIVRCKRDEENHVADSGFEDFLYIDAYNDGRFLDQSSCAELLNAQFNGRLHFRPEFLRPLTSREILARMINNLKSIYSEAKVFGRLLTLYELLLVLNPLNGDALRERALVKALMGDHVGAVNDLNNYFQAVSSDNDQLKAVITKSQLELAQLN